MNLIFGVLLFPILFIHKAAGFNSKHGYIYKLEEKFRVKSPSGKHLASTFRSHVGFRSEEEAS